MTELESTISSVAICRTPYKQKFGIPRQPGLVDVKGTIEFINEFNHPDYVEGIEQYSHLWLLFRFHENLSQGYKAKVRPPRLGGNDKMGVFATRSTFRPNGIGQSVVKLHQVTQKSGQLALEISGMDLVDGTPILDIKPYLPFSDSLPEAKAGFAQNAPNLLQVKFDDAAKQQLTCCPNANELEILISQVLSQDPRPAYKKDKPDSKQYFIRLFNFDIAWRVYNTQVVVSEVKFNN